MLAVVCDLKSHSLACLLVCPCTTLIVLSHTAHPHKYRQFTSYARWSIVHFGLWHDVGHRSGFAVFSLGICGTLDGGRLRLVAGRFCQTRLSQGRQTGICPTQWCTGTIKVFFENALHCAMMVFLSKVIRLFLM